MEELVDKTVLWFDRYYNSFENLDQMQQTNFGIKKKHSERVAALSMSLAEKMKWERSDTDISFLTGLLHDTGRFRQLADFNTFNDERSIDHANLSVQILEEEKVLDTFNSESKDIILQAIYNHNKFAINPALKGKHLLVARLLRDADKLDILQVLSEYYNNKNAAPNHTLTWELPKNHSVSKNVIKEVLAGKLVSKKNVISENDVKIMQLSWVFDIHFRPSFEYLANSRVLTSIFNTLPKNDEIIEVYRKVKVYTENRILN